MTVRTNAFDQPIGEPVSDWSRRSKPPRTPMGGRTCRVEPLDASLHADDLWQANADDAEGRNWTYLHAQRPEDAEAYGTWITRLSASTDPLLHAIVDAKTGKAMGLAAYLRIDPSHGSIEVGHINYSPRLQRTTAATEAMYLMMRRAFDELGYRRYEWKCDSLNAPSRAAATRLGFTFEGIFRQAVVYKGRNRDTAWFSIIDGEWPAIKAAFERWLDPANFDEDGRQRQSLPDLMRVATP
jgi:RimJ/RimL family protein N-acetyltransferase